MEFRLLGPVEARRDDRPIGLGGAKPRALLALLLLQPNEVVSRDRLLEALWPDRAPGAAEHSLDVQVSRLRKALSPDDVLRTRAGGYVLEVEPEQIDMRRFEGLLEEGRRANAAGEPAEALRTLDAALSLWRGDALGEVAYEDFARAEAERLDELRLVAIEERIDAELALARHDTVVAELESLTAHHPLRERLRGQLMLALYRAGRQAEALRVYTDTRKRLVDELGIEPGQALKALEQAILRQDPGLDVDRSGSERRRRRALAGAGAIVLAALVVAVLVGLTQGGTPRAEALADASSNVLLSATSGALVGDVPVRDTVGVRFGAGSLWSVSSEGLLTRIDPETGNTVATIGLGIVEPGGLAVGEGSVWVTDAFSPTLLRVDPAVNEVVDRFPLPEKGVVTDLTGGVALGAGSVWVGHGQFNPGAWIERLDPVTGRVQARISILGGDAGSVAFGDGAVWVGSKAAGEVRKIDPSTNTIVFTRPLRPQSQLRAVAAGGGFGWAALEAEPSVWKMSRDGSIVGTVELPAAAKSLTYAEGALWAAVGERGAVVRIDPTTDALRLYEVDHDVTDADAREGLIAAGLQPSTEDVTADLKGDVVRIGLASNALFQIGGPTLPSTDPALYAPWDKNLQQFDYATCAKLYNYRDAEGAPGRRVVPEVADGFPIVSNGGRTYTIAIRRGFRFSPPSNAPVTAEAFRTAIERGLSPKFASDYLDPRWKILAGAEAYNAGRSEHVSGVSAEGDTLVLRLTAPVPDLPRILALSVFCAVPPGTPIVPHGLNSPVPSAGPYYLAALTESVAVLKPNPNYGGDRPQKLDAIVHELGVAPKDAAARIDDGTLDYVLEGDPALAPGSAAARSAGARFRLSMDATGHVFYLAFNTARPLFADVGTRRAVQYALDRHSLAAADPGGAAPATRIVSPKVSGYAAGSLYPFGGDLRTARRLAAGRKARAVVYAFDDHPYTDAFNRALRQQLAAIGIGMTLLPMTNEDFAEDRVQTKAARADLVWGGASAETSDPVAYLEQLNLSESDRKELRRIAELASPERERNAAALARRIERKSLFAVYGVGAIPELVSKRLGCIVHQPEYAGVDLAALCLKR